MRIAVMPADKDCYLALGVPARSFVNRNTHMHVTQLTFMQQYAQVMTIGIPRNVTHQVPPEVL
jgi:hypothetical protein